jgi:hypothetical protein
MPTSYTSLLGLALPVTGELSGTWGDTVNDYLTQYLDASVAGTQTISGSQTSVTLSKTTATSLSQAGSGSTGSSQYVIINCTGSPASTLTITAPAASKPYIVINGTSTSQSVVIRGAGPTTGVTIPSGQRALVAWNGSDFVQVGASAGGSNTQVQFNSSGALAGSANLTFNGTTLTANDIIDSSLTASKPVFTNASKNLVSTGTVPVDQGGTGLATTTAYSVVFTGTTATGNFQASAGPGTSGHVLTSNGAGALPTFQALPASGVSKGQSIAFALIFGL